MFSVNKNFNTVIILISLCIAITTGITISVYTSKFELILGISTFAFLSLGIFVSLQSLDTASAARADSEKSADATFISAETASETFQFSLEQAKQEKKRYRIENSSLLNIYKDEMYFPIGSPFDFKNDYLSQESYSTKEYDTVTLINNGVGTASSIDISWNFINAYEFDDFRFVTSEIEELASLFDRGQLNLENSPQYHLEVEYITIDGSSDKICISGELENKNLIEPEYIFVREENVISHRSRRVGIQRTGDQYSFNLPINYLILARQFFLERIMVCNESAWITPNPLLKVRVEYTEERLEHMNDFEEAKRVKEFEINCSENVEVTKSKQEDGAGTEYLVLRCNFNIRVIHDLSLSEIMAK